MTEKQKEGFRKNVKRFLIDRNMSQKELAEKTGISESMIAHIVNGTKHPPVDKLFALANYMGVSVDDLVNKPLFL